MTVTLQKNPKYETGESTRKSIVNEFYIDYGRCMRCNICAEVCPTNFRAITLQGSSWLTDELAVLERPDLVMDLDQLLAASKYGILINPLTPEQNHLAPDGSRARRWAGSELEIVSGPVFTEAPARLWRPLRWAKVRLLKFRYRNRDRQRSAAPVRTD
jgi:ferredoxin